MSDVVLASPAEGASLRTKLVSMSLCLVFGIIAVKAGMVAINGPEGEAGVARAFEQPVQRADIVDRDGELLATSVAVYSLFADPRAIWDPADVATGLAKVFPDLDVDELTADLGNRDRAFVWVRRGLTPRQRDAPALPRERKLCSELLTSPNVARHSARTLRISPDRNLSVT